MPATETLEAALAQVDGWGAEHAAAAVVSAGGDVLASRGDPTFPFAWASVTKLVTATAVLIGVERGLVEVDEAAGPPGATVRHLLAHASGLPFEGSTVLAQPGRLRIYSNPAYDLLGALVAERVGKPFGDVLEDWVLEPLGMTAAALDDRRPSSGLMGPLPDLVALARECLRPGLLTAGLFATATAPVFPGLAGVVPGIGRFDPCDWGLGFEIRDGKAPHWTGSANSPATFGHFGGTGTFLWIDPVARLGLAVLTDRDFGAWALDAWPRLSDGVLAASNG
jgi:CubicO group peptidase (beta-lactamase class C family)